MAHTEDVLWCEFSELCFKPRSPADFIEIAKYLQYCSGEQCAAFNRFLV